MGDVDAVRHDDRLIEAAARGESLDRTDAAEGPLLALSQVADARPLPRLDLEPGALADPHRSRRYAVRSLAAALVAVTTLSASGVAAVVTGDPFRPVKAVWQQIQEHAGDRVRVQGEGAADPGSTSGLGRSSDRPARVGTPRSDAPPTQAAEPAVRASGPSARDATGPAVPRSEPRTPDAAAAAPVRPDAAGRPGQSRDDEPQALRSDQAGSEPEQDPARARPEERSADASSEDAAGSGPHSRAEPPASPAPPTPEDDGSAPAQEPADEDDQDGRQERRADDDGGDLLDDGDVALPFRHSARPDEEVDEHDDQRERAGDRPLARMATSRPPVLPDRASPSPRETSTDREEVPWN